MVLVNLFMDGIAQRYALVSTGSTRTDWVRRPPSPFGLSLSKGPCIVSLSNSLRLLTDAMHSFNRHCVAGLQANEPRMEAMVDDSLMRVTALSPHIGYCRAAFIAERAHQKGISLRTAALEIGDITPQEFDAWMDVKKMLAPSKQNAVKLDLSPPLSRSSS